MFSNGFLDAFNTVKAGGDSPLMDNLLKADSRLNAGETGSQMVRRLYASNLTLNSVGGAGVGHRHAAAERPIGDPAFRGPAVLLHPLSAVHDATERPGFERFLDLQCTRSPGGPPLPQRRVVQSRLYLGEIARHALVRPHHHGGQYRQQRIGQLHAVRHLQPRIELRAIRLRPGHLLQWNFVDELPLGKGKHFLSGASGLANRIVGGWEVSGYGRVTSGRPFTVYSGSNTFSSVVQTPANCTGCSGRRHAFPGFRQRADLVPEPHADGAVLRSARRAVRQHRAELPGGAALLRAGCLAVEAGAGDREGEAGIPRRRDQPDQLGYVWPAHGHGDQQHLRAHQQHHLQRIAEDPDWREDPLLGEGRGVPRPYDWARSVAVSHPFFHSRKYTIARAT